MAKNAIYVNGQAQLPQERSQPVVWVYVDGQLGALPVGQQEFPPLNVTVGTIYNRVPF